INAEDPNQSFLPQSGRIDQLILPGGSNVRFDTVLYPNYIVPNNFDSLIGKLIVWGRSRSKAITLSKHALRELTISGIKTNIELHQAIIKNRDFIKWNLSTDFLKRNKITGVLKDYERIKLAAVLQVFEMFKVQINHNAEPKLNIGNRNKWRDYNKIHLLK
ncbi:MAG: hypothetical protein ACTSWL_07355, partial [Promethearchaeota archaeon]